MSDSNGGAAAAAAGATNGRGRGREEGWAANQEARPGVTTAHHGPGNIPQEVEVEVKGSRNKLTSFPQIDQSFTSTTVTAGGVDKGLGIFN